MIRMRAQTQVAIRPCLKFLSHSVRAKSSLLISQSVIKTHQYYYIPTFLKEARPGILGSEKKNIFFQIEK